MTGEVEQAPARPPLVVLAVRGDGAGCCVGAVDEAVGVVAAEAEEGGGEAGAELHEPRPVDVAPAAADDAGVQAEAQELRPDPQLLGRPRDADGEFPQPLDGLQPDDQCQPQLHFAVFVRCDLSREEGRSW